MQKILILTAIPHGLQLGREVRIIEEAIQRAAKRELFEISIKTAVRIVDIRSGHLCFKLFSSKHLIIKNINRC